MAELDREPVQDTSTPSEGTRGAVRAAIEALYSRTDLHSRAIREAARAADDALAALPSGSLPEGTDTREALTACVAALKTAWEWMAEGSSTDVDRQRQRWLGEQWERGVAALAASPSQDRDAREKLGAMLQRAFAHAMQRDVTLTRVSLLAAMEQAAKLGAVFPKDLSGGETEDAGEWRLYRASEAPDGIVVMGNPPPRLEVGQYVHVFAVPRADDDAPMPASVEEWRAHCAFHRLAVSQRDAAWREIETLKSAAPSPTGDREREALTAIERARAAIAFERYGNAEDILAAVVGDILPCAPAIAREQAGRIVAAADAFSRQLLEDGERTGVGAALRNDFKREVEYLAALAASPSPTGGEPDARERADLAITDRDGDVLNLVEMRDGKVMALIVNAHQRAAVWLTPSDQQKVAEYFAPPAPTAGEGESRAWTAEQIETAVTATLGFHSVNAIRRFDACLRTLLAGVAQSCDMCGEPATRHLDSDGGMACTSCFTALTEAGCTSIARPAGEGDDTREGCGGGRLCVDLRAHALLLGHLLFPVDVDTLQRIEEEMASVPASADPAYARACELVAAELDGRPAMGRIGRTRPAPASSAGEGSGDDDR